MEFLPPNPELLRRSKCGNYLIEKEIGEDGVTRYCMWVMAKVIYGYKNAQEAVDDARSREEEAVAAWRARRAAEASKATDDATLASGRRPPAPECG